MADRETPRLDDFTLLKVIGKGSYGKVMLVRHKDDPEETVYAMKMLRKENVIKRNQVEHTKTERNVLEAVSHPFIVTLHYAFQTPKKLYFVLEYCPGGELFFHLSRAGRFSEGRCRFYASEILLAIEYLHRLNIIYRDLKPENILLASDGYLKLTDFGFAKKIEHRTYTLCGTPEYIAPEVLLNKGHGKPVDWWTLGILVYEMIVGYPPFVDEDPMGIYQKILAGKVYFPKYFDKNAKALVKKLLTADLSKRYGNLKDGPMDILKHAWFSSLNFAELEEFKVPAPYKPAMKGDNDVSNFEDIPESKDVSPAVTGATDPFTDW